MRGGAPDAGAEIPLQTVEKTKVAHVFSLQHMENHSKADIHTAAHGGPHTRAFVYILKEGVAPTHTEVGSWQEHAREHTLEQVFCQEPWPMGDPQGWILFLKNYIPWKVSILEQFLKSYRPWEGHTLE